MKVIIGIVVEKFNLIYLVSSLLGNVLLVLSKLLLIEWRNYSLLVEIFKNRYGLENRVEVFKVIILDLSWK